MHRHYILNYFVFLLGVGEPTCIIAQNTINCYVLLCLPRFKGSVPLLCENCSLQQRFSVSHWRLCGRAISENGSPLDRCFWFSVGWERVTVFPDAGWGEESSFPLVPWPARWVSPAQALASTSSGASSLTLLLAAAAGLNRSPPSS